MRQVGLADIECAARVLIRLPAVDQPRAIAELINNADTADRYRKRLGRMHPQFGSGTLMSAAQSLTKGKRSEFIGDDMLRSMSFVISALRCDDHIMYCDRCNHRFVLGL